MRVQDVMTRGVIGIAPSASISEAIRLMLSNRLSGLPVVEADGRLVGVVTEGDFLRRSELETKSPSPGWLSFLAGPGRLADRYVHGHGRRVSEIMSLAPVTVAAGARLNEAVDLMVEHHVKRLPVMESDRLVGIVARSDLLRALADKLPGETSELAGDEQIRRAIETSLAGQPWAGRNDLVRVRVTDGIVELEGTITDERQRAAYVVAAENVAGVRGVLDHLVWVEPISGMVVLSPHDQAAAARADRTPQAEAGRD